MAKQIKPLKPADDYLKFVQQAFNVEDVSYEFLITNMEQMYDMYTQDNTLFHSFQKANEEQKQRVKRLKETGGDILPLKPGELQSLFTDISNTINRDSINGFSKAVRITEKVVQDLVYTRKWLEEYSRLKNMNVFLDPLHALETMGRAILGRAVELCPILTGRLRASGTLFVFPPSSVVITFSAPYATYVHENLNNFHPRGQAKFLEQALQEFLPDQSTWVEVHGESIVYAQLGVEGSVYYRHYD